ncbi:hypothetical protein L9F63_009858, partial [Diploptera punctata]
IDLVESLRGKNKRKQLDFLHNQINKMDGMFRPGLSCTSIINISTHPQKLTFNPSKQPFSPLPHSRQLQCYVKLTSCPFAASQSLAYVIAHASINIQDVGFDAEIYIILITVQETKYP